jgi:hypothetical protein
MFSLRFHNIKRKFVDTHIVQSFCMIVFAFLFSSCEQDVNIDLKTNDKRLLVDGEFTSDSVIHTVKLYCAGSLITGKPQTVVTGAKIIVTDGVETFEYIENADTLGLYQTTIQVGGKGGHLYTLSITNIDIDKDGKMDSYTANSLMPVPVKFDSLVSKRGLNGDGNMAVNNYAYYKLYFNGPDYVYKSELLNNIDQQTQLTNRLGTGAFTRDENQYKVPKVLDPCSFKNYWSYLSINSTVVSGDNISFICLNLTKDQYSFLKIFDNTTSRKDLFNSENIYDQLKVPTNLPTNIEPADKAAGYFFVYSISRISKVFNQ